MSKFLEWLGLHVMTNKEALLEELNELDGAAFEHMVVSRQSDLPDRLFEAMCADCKTRYGGKCPHPGDNDCHYEMADWLAEPCKHERLIETRNERSVEP